MKRKLQIIISTSAASVLAFLALAQDTAIPHAGRPAYTRGAAPQLRLADRLNGAAKASELIGMTVKNYQGETLGKVEDLAVDVESGRLVQMIVSTGGFLGIGDTLAAVPPGALEHDVAQRVLYLDATRVELKAAPQFAMSRWVECCDSNHLATVYRHYGQEPAFRFIRIGDAIPDGRHYTGGAPNALSTRRADGTWDLERISSQSQSMIPASRLAQIQRASTVMGKLLRNLQDEKLGKVEDILLDLPAGRIVAVIITSGGFLGMGHELSAIPPTALRFSTDRDTLRLDASKESLSNAPHFQANQWPEIGQSSYAGGVDRTYGSELYFATNVTTEADNTARNVRDHNSSTLTPRNQGDSQADLDTTAQIRKEIFAGKGVSVKARNVKIITNKGQVTLRGSVNTIEGKRFIGELADRIARSENVDNQLEVKLTTSSGK